MKWESNGSEGVESEWKPSGTECDLEWEWIAVEWVRNECGIGVNGCGVGVDGCGIGVDG